MTTRLNVALPNVPGIKSFLLGPASPSRFDISTCSSTNGSATPWKTDTICLFLPSSSSFSLQFWSLFQEFRPIVDPLLILFFGSVKDSVQSISLNYVSFSHLSLFIPISPLFESLFSKSIPIVVLIFLPFFSLYLEFLFSKDSYLIISPRFSYSLPLSISTSVLSFLSFKDSVQRYRFFSLSPFLPFLLFSLSRSTFSFVSFKDSLFLSFFVQSSIQNHVLPLSLLFSFHIYLFQLCPLLHDRSTLKIHVFPYEFLPLPFRG